MWCQWCQSYDDEIFFSSTKYYWRDEQRRHSGHWGEICDTELRGNRNTEVRLLMMMRTYLTCWVQTNNHLEERGWGDDPAVWTSLQWRGLVHRGGGVCRRQSHSQQSQQVEQRHLLQIWFIIVSQVSVWSVSLHRQEQCSPECEQESAVVCWFSSHALDHSPAGGGGAGGRGAHRVSHCSSSQGSQLLARQVWTVHHSEVSFNNLLQEPLNQHNMRIIRKFSLNPLKQSWLKWY